MTESSLDLHISFFSSVCMKQVLLKERKMSLRSTRQQAFPFSFPISMSYTWAFPHAAAELLLHCFWLWYPSIPTKPISGSSDNNLNKKQLIGRGEKNPSVVLSCPREPPGARNGSEKSLPVLIPFASPVLIPLPHALQSESRNCSFESTGKPRTHSVT